VEPVLFGQVHVKELYSRATVRPDGKMRERRAGDVPGKFPKISAVS